ncbi:MAG TPA: DUF4835 family protein [Cyclobacteriaceae bacterium]|nr:DUF4835 family protein [Cyclobacteriaceae bacterium]
MRKLFILFFLICSLPALAQELQATVTINVGPKVETTDRNVFRDMKTAFQQFLNSRKWTSDTYQQHEKINCSILININDMPSIGAFNASVVIQSARPVYNSNYTSLLLNFADRDWQFEYIESQPLEFNDNTFTNNLTSMLAFYAYLVIGLDYDSFSELGGTPYFQRALMVVNNAQSSNRPGWQSLGSNRNRYWIVENLLNPQMADVRRALYSYHRLGLDTFEKTPDQSRLTILTGLKNIRKAKDINPNAILIISFFDAKSKELANIFSGGQLTVRREAYDLITMMDPSNQAAYAKILKN